MIDHDRNGDVSTLPHRRILALSGVKEYPCPPNTPNRSLYQSSNQDNSVIRSSPSMNHHVNNGSSPPLRRSPRRLVAHPALTVSPSATKPRSPSMLRNVLASPSSSSSLRKHRPDGIMPPTESQDEPIKYWNSSTATNTDSKSATTEPTPIRHKKIEVLSPSDSFSPTSSLSSLSNSPQPAVGLAMVHHTGKVPSKSIRRIDYSRSHHTEEDSFCDKSTSLGSSQLTGYSLSVPQPSRPRILHKDHSKIQQSGSPIAKKSGSDRINRALYKGDGNLTTGHSYYTPSNKTNHRNISTTATPKTGNTKWGTTQEISNIDSSAVKIERHTPETEIKSKNASPTPNSQLLSDNSPCRAARYGLGPKLKLSNDAHEIILGAPQYPGHAKQENHISSSNSTNAINKTYSESNLSQAKLKRSRTATIDTGKGNMDSTTGNGNSAYASRNIYGYSDKIQGQHNQMMSSQVVHPNIQGSKKGGQHFPPYHISEARNETKLPPRVSSLLASSGAQTSNLPAPVEQRGSTPRKYRPTITNILPASESNSPLPRRQKEYIESSTVSPSSLSQAPPEYTPCPAIPDRITETIHQSGTLSSVRNVGKGFRNRISFILSKRLRSERTKVQAPEDPKAQSDCRITNEEIISFHRHTHTVSHNIVPSDNIRVGRDSSRVLVSDPSTQSVSKTASHAPQHPHKKLHKVKNLSSNERSSNSVIPTSHSIPANLPDKSNEPCLPAFSPSLASLDRMHKKQDQNNDDELGVSALLDKALRDASEELGKVIDLRQKITSPVAKKALDGVILSIGNAIGAARASRIATLELEKATINLVQMVASATSMTGSTVRDAVNGL